MILADKIIELRKKNGLSQEELAEKLNVSRQSISKWEGAQSIPDMNKILKLSDLFSVSTDYLLKDEIEEMETQVPIEDHDSSVREASVSMEEANAYLAYKSRIATPMAFAVLLLLCPPPLSLLYRPCRRVESSPFPKARRAVSASFSCFSSSVSGLPSS